MENIKNVYLCTNTTDCTELSRTSGLYLKPVSHLSITVTLPQLRSGQSISNGELMEKLKSAIHPHKFVYIKVSKSTLEFVRFDAETDDRSTINKVISKIDQKGIKLSGLSDLLKIRAIEAKLPFPSRHEWDSYFRDAKHMNEMKPGERPDTIYIQGLPCRWFAHIDDKNPNKPSEYVLSKVFASFGDVRIVDIPCVDPYRLKMTPNIRGVKTSSFPQDNTFSAFIQYKEYIGFDKCMRALQNQKLVFVEDDTAWSAIIEVDFDRTKHLSEYSIKKRCHERDRLIVVEKEKDLRALKAKEIQMKKSEEERIQKLKEREAKKEEKMLRRKEREENRRLRRILKKGPEETNDLLGLESDDELTIKIALEERKLLVAQRKLESIRLMDELFERIKFSLQMKTSSLKSFKKSQGKKFRSRVIYGGDMAATKERQKIGLIVDNLICQQEELMQQQRRKVYRVIQGKMTLNVDKDQLHGSLSPISNSTANSDSEVGDSDNLSSVGSYVKKISASTDVTLNESENWGQIPEAPPQGQFGSHYYQDLDNYSSQPHNEHWFPGDGSFRGYDRGRMRGHRFMRRGRGFRDRGFWDRGRGRGFRGRGGRWQHSHYGYDHHEGKMKSQSEHKRRHATWFTRSGSERSSYSRSRSRSRSRRRSRSRHRTRSYSRSSRSTRSRSKSRSRSRSWSRSRDRSRSQDRKKSRSRSRSRCRSREKSDGSHRRSRSHSKEGGEDKSKAQKSRSRSKSKSGRSRSSSKERSKARKSRSRSRSRSKRSRSKSRSRSRSRKRSRSKYSRSRSRDSRSRSRSRGRSKRSRYRSRSYSGDRDNSYSRYKAKKYSKKRGSRRNSDNINESDIEFSSFEDEEENHEENYHDYNYPDYPPKFPHHPRDPAYKKFNPQKGFEEFEGMGGRGNFMFRGRGRFNNRRGPRGWRPRFRGRGNFITQHNYYQDKKVNYRHEEVEQYREMYNKYFSSVAEREGNHGSYKDDESKGEIVRKHSKQEDPSTSNDHRRESSHDYNESRYPEDIKESRYNREPSHDSKKHERQKNDSDSEVVERRYPREARDDSNERSEFVHDRDRDVKQNRKKRFYDSNSDIRHMSKGRDFARSAEQKDSDRHYSKYSNYPSGKRHGSPSRYSKSPPSRPIKREDQDDDSSDNGARRVRDTVRSKIYRINQIERNKGSNNHGDKLEEIKGKLYSDREKPSIRDRIGGAGERRPRGRAFPVHGNMAGRRKRNISGDDFSKHRNSGQQYESYTDSRSSRASKVYYNEAKSEAEHFNDEAYRQDIQEKISVKKSAERKYEESGLESDESGAREYQKWKKENEAKNKDRQKHLKDKNKERESSVSSSSKKKKKKKKKSKKSSSDS